MFESDEEMACPDCGEEIPIRMEICPHCETALQ